MALHYEMDIPGGMMSVTINGITIEATFDYPAACGDRSHEADTSDTTFEAFCNSETVTLNYEDFDLAADAVVTFTDTRTRKAYRWNVERPGESGWTVAPPDPRHGRSWWLEAARNVLRS